MRDEPGIRFGIAQALVLLALVLSRPFGLGTLATDALLVTVGAAVGAFLNWSALAFTGVLAWAWATGFVENQYGVLSFTGPDLERLGASVAGALLLAEVCRCLLRTRAAH